MHRQSRLSFSLGLLLLLLALAAEAFGANIIFPPPKTALTDKYAAIAGKTTPNALVDWQWIKPSQVVTGQSQATSEGIFTIPLELEPGLNRITIEGNLTEIFYNDGSNPIPQGFVKRRMHAGDTATCTDCHERQTMALAEKGYPGVCLNCHIVASQNPESTKDPSEDSHFKSVQAKCSNCHEAHYSQNQKLLDPSKTRRPCAPCHNDKYTGEESHKAYEEGGCAACHDSHFSGFPRQLNQNMPGVCNDCHGQGANINPKLVHAPSDKGVPGCAKCHNPHGSGPKLLRKSLKDTCTACHPKVLKGGHGEELVDCTKCHDPHMQLGTGLLRKDFPAGCESCHDNVKKGKNLHKPVAQGCSSCHAPHSDDNRTKALSRCLQCHDMGPTTDTSKLHGALPMEVKSCKLCHDPHSSDQTHLLKKKTHFPLTQGKCDACHSNTGGTESLKVTDMVNRCGKCHSVVRDLTARNAKLHEPVSDGDCTACHQPHMSGQKKYMKQSMVETCGQCHDQAKVKEGQTLHPAAADCSDCHGAHGGELKKFLKSKVPALCLDCHDDPSKNKKVVHAAMDDGCTACHDPHAGYGKKLLRKKGSDICLECHKNPIEGLKVVHPAMDEDCTACHNPHGSDNKKLVKLPGNKLCLNCHSDPTTGGTAHPAVDDGCTTCHRPHASQVKKLLTDSVSKLCINCHSDPAAKKKNVHPALDDGCTACHDPHVAKTGKQLVKPVNKICAECHDSLKKDHHDMKAAGASSYPKDKGVFPVVGTELSCIGCHNPHASDERMLFGGKESDLCSSCH